MAGVRCPECRRGTFYFDSPSRNELYLYCKNGEFFVYDVIKMKKVRKTEDIAAMFESEIQCPEWSWTCEHCAEGIDEGMRQWSRLQKLALEYLR